MCYNVAEKRLEKYNYPIKNIRKILGKYTIEDEIGEDNIKSYLKKTYPNKQRIENKLEDVYKDFKVAAAFQILRENRRKKRYAGEYLHKCDGLEKPAWHMVSNSYRYRVQKEVHRGFWVLQCLTQLLVVEVILFPIPVKFSQNKC